MNDFEVCERGTQEEIRLSRKVANEIEWVIQSGGVMPVQIRNAYNKLREFYDLQVENDLVKQEDFSRPLRNSLYKLRMWE
jgi:hypothetical protein